MTDEEMKKKAERTATKTLLVQKKIIEEETAGMTDEEGVKFTFYYLAAYGAFINQADQLSTETEKDVNMHDYVDAMTNAYEMVYENDQKPEWDA